MSIEAGKAYDMGDVSGRKLFEIKGGTVYQLPPAEREKWIDAALSVKEAWLKDMQSKDLPAQEVFDYAQGLLVKY